MSQAADPFQIVAMQDGMAIVSLDNILFQEMPTPAEDENPDHSSKHFYGYRTTDRTLWRIWWLEAWLQRINFRAYPFVERELQKATRLPMASIQKTMDEHKKQCRAAYPQIT